ncbi:MAG: hypothetical protein ABI461_23550 [Polyangiaceae bacterium]
MRLRPWLLAFAIASFGVSARADSASDADALVEHGVALREQGHDDLALQEFQKANALSPSARALAQIGLAEQALGVWRDAERDVSTALAVTGDPWIEKNRAALEAAKNTIQNHLGSLEIRCDAPGAEIFVDGATRGKIAPGVSIRVEAGPRDVEVRAPGRHASSRSVLVPAGGVARETITLEPLPVATAEPQRDPLSPTLSPSRDDHRDDDAGASQRSVGWAFLGTSAALLVTGFVGIGARDLEITSYNNDGSCPGLSAVDQPPLCQSKIDTAQTWTTVSIVGFVGAGVLATGGAVLLLTAPRASKSSAKQAQIRIDDHATESRRHAAPSHDLLQSFACGAALGIYCGGQF